MTNSITQQPPESRLRRWWRRFYDTVQAMDTSGYEFFSDRVHDLEKRVGRMEALHTPPKNE